MSAQLDGVLQDRLEHGRSRSSSARVSLPARRRGPNPGPKEALVRIDVAHPGQQRLLSSAALMASLRPRNSAANASAPIVSGSSPAPRNPLPNASLLAALPAPTAARSSRTAAAQTARVHKANLAPALEPQPRMGVRRHRPFRRRHQQPPRHPRWTIHCASGICASAFERRLPASRSAAPRATRASSQTMCFPVRWTATCASLKLRLLGSRRLERLPCDPNHASTMRSPLTRAFTPRAIVSTSGSSGMNPF